jgi:hypothetical protein
MDTNINAKNIPAEIPNKLPTKLPGVRSSKKNKEIPMVTNTTTNISERVIFFLNKIKDSSKINIGAVYCKTIALAEVVSLLATTKLIQVPESPMPARRE